MNRLSLVISARNAAGHLERCLASVAPQRSELQEVIVVDDGSVDGSAEVARAAGCDVIRFARSRGICTARNAGARMAVGDVIVFIDADTSVEPGWAHALREAFDDGATLVGGGLRWPEPRTLAEHYQFGGRWHDETARNGFLPFVSGAHFAIRREVFLDLGGFDEVLPSAEDVDLSFRAQLAGHSVSFAPDAELVHWPRSTIWALFRQRMHHVRGRRVADYKYRHFPFVRMDRSRPKTSRILFGSVSRIVLAGTGGDRRRLVAPGIDSMIRVARRLGILRADLEMLTGIQPLPVAVRSIDAEQRNTASPLPGRPALLLIGDDPLVMSALLLALRARDVALAPPGLEDSALRRWDEPAPWSLRLARSAVREGWPLALETAALRIEREQPRTWGEAFLTLHRVHAWANERRHFGLAATGESGWRLAERLGNVPIVVAGAHRNGSDRVAFHVTRADLLRDRQDVFRRAVRVRQAAIETADRER
jgi:glycosyltransferase involved in cell wall biosynthesis